MRAAPITERVTSPTWSPAVVVIPTLNEAETIVPLLERITATGLGLDVLVVDDRSPDGTANAVREYAKEYSSVHVLERDRQGGFAGAYRAGFRWALEREYSSIVQMDADGSHQPEFLRLMLDALDDLGGAGLVVGSRWVSGGRVVDWPLRRLVLSRGGNAYIRLILGTRVRDATGGFRVWSRDALEAVEPGSLTSVGYAFQIESLRRAEQAGVRVREIPIVFPERTRGVSKMSGSIVREALVQVTRWGVADRREGFRRLAVRGARGVPCVPRVRGSRG